MEIELKGNVYRIGKLNVFDQWNVARRLMPAIGALTDIKDSDSLTKTLMPVLQSLGTMSDTDMEYILTKCLAVVKREQNINGVTAVSGILGNGNVMMFDDIDMFAMLRLTTFVVVENMGDFFTQAALDGSIAAAMSVQAKSD